MIDGIGPDVFGQARRMTHAKRDILIDHVAAPQPIDRRPAKGDAARRKRLITEMIGRGFLMERCFDYRHAGARRAATHTHLTERGRQVAAVILADAADALVRGSGLDDVKGLKMTPTKLREQRLLMASAPALTEK